MSTPADLLSQRRIELGSKIFGPALIPRAPRNQLPLPRFGAQSIRRCPVDCILRVRRSRGQLLLEDDSVAGVLARGASGSKASILCPQRIVATFQCAQVGGGGHAVQDEEDTTCRSPSVPPFSHIALVACLELPRVHRLS
jgi:hypothetical protein